MTVFVFLTQDTIYTKVQASLCYTLQPNQVRCAPQDYIYYLSNEPASCFKNTISEFIIEKQNPLVIPSTQPMGLKFKNAIEH